MDMVSRKKAKGKARRAAKATDAKCHHGLVPAHRRQNHGEFLNTSNDLKSCKGFLQRFAHAFDAAGGNFPAAYHASKEEDAELWSDPDKMKFVVSYLIAIGTSKVLEGHAKIASKYASLACYFEQYLKVDLLGNRPYPNFPKINELYFSDEHTLVSFLKNRIPCSCLDEKYDEVKSIPKIGLCCNPECPLPGGLTTRSATKCCDRCRWAANYCSEACQKAAWPAHKADCDFYVDCFNADLEASYESNNPHSS